MSEEIPAVIYLEPADWDRFMQEMSKSHEPTRAAIEANRLWHELRVALDEGAPI